ncbi:cellulose-binding protein [Phormidium tenue FACHB-886]|nr:cellulose-binding protein [Phormidium tenue FACHB-886]
MISKLPLLKRRSPSLRAIAYLAIFSLTVFFSLSCAQVATTATATAASGAGATLALGTNLNGINDWSTEVPFLDAFKLSREWLTQCEGGEPGCTGGWATDEFDQLDLDEHGWVKSLPAPEDSPEFTRVRTILFGGNGKFESGQYVVLYDGEGTIEYVYDAVKDEAASRPGRDVLNVDFSRDGEGIHLIITATDPKKTGNYIRNIRVVPIAYEATYEQQIFNPVFLERTKKFSAIRFMDWMNTNETKQRDWANRPKVDDRSYALGKGVPVEIMVQLANRLGANPWFNMPHAATDDYVRNFARLVKQQLDPGLNAYVELSNEVWNWSFPQSQYALAQGKARWGEDKGDSYMQWYGMRSAQISDIWKREFGADRDRVVAVFGTQTAWQGLEEMVLNCPYWVAEGNKPCHEQADAYAITGYVSGNLGAPEHQKTIESWLSQADGGSSKAFEWLSKDMKVVSDAFTYHAKVAKDKGLRLVAYEGGQHVVGWQGVENNEKLTNLFIEVNRHPKMREIYTQLLNDWQKSGGTLFMHFSDISEPSKWGSWGALEYVNQESSPKYDALMEFIEQNRLR